MTDEKLLETLEDCPAHYGLEDTFAEVVIVKAVARIRELKKHFTELARRHDETRAALYWIRALYPDAQLLNDLDDDNNTGCRSAYSINTPTIAELQKIDTALGL